ncbi:MAG: rhodanese-like domain-containing protein [Putridiphycobacter sp.]|nr:rhodanese-like domain-containing protein [Putridiphycobacter sp.]
MKVCPTICIAIVLMFLSGCRDNKQSVLISAQELLINKSQYKIIDISTEEDFQKQSIVGAYHLWRPDITEESAVYGGLMASEEKMEDLLSKLGILPEDQLVVYDHKGGCDAARLWWILTYYGHDNVRLLDGGMSDWKGAFNTKSQYSEKQKHSNYQFSQKENTVFRKVELDEVIAALNDPKTVLIDTRSTDEFEGLVQKDGAFKKGRIPGSIHIDWASNIDYHGNQKILSSEKLLNMYEAKGVTKDKNVIVYCHSGVRSAHTAVVLSYILGYKNVGNYDGSWIEWSYHKELPVALGK